MHEEVSGFVPIVAVCMHVFHLTLSEPSASFAPQQKGSVDQVTSPLTVTSPGH